MSITVLPYSGTSCLIKTVGEASVNLVSINASTGAVSSSVLTSDVINAIQAQTFVLRNLVGLSDFPTVLPTAMYNLVSASPLATTTGLTVSISTVGAISTMAITGLTDPCWFFGSAAPSVGGGFFIPTATTDPAPAGGGGGGGDGTVPAPGGPYGAIPNGTPVAISGGVLVAADAGDITKMPCIGFYTGSATNLVRTSGVQNGLTLAANQDYYVAVGGGVTATPPSGVGVFLQRMGKSVNVTELFVTVSESIANP